MFEPTRPDFTFGQLYEFRQIMTRCDFLMARGMVLCNVRTDFNLTYQANRPLVVSTNEGYATEVTQICNNNFSIWFSNKISFQALRAPVGRIYFAGEAYSADYMGFMDGAFESGRDQCKILLSCEADSGKCEHYVPPYEARGCTYRAATNYDNTALEEDGSCTFPE